MSCEIRDDLGPDLPTAAQDAEDRGLDRPAPSLAASARWLKRRFRQKPPKYVSSISTVPWKTEGTSRRIAARKRVRARNTRWRWSAVSSAMAAALSPRTWHRNRACH